LSKNHALTLAFCGIDGSGKTSLAESVRAWIGGQGVQAVLHKARTGRSGLERLGHGDVTAIAGGEGAVLMMTAIAWQSIRDAKEARRKSGSVLIFDRYTPCLLALCRHFAPEAEDKVRTFVDTLPKTDITIYVDTSPETAAQRLALRGGGAKPLAFLKGFDLAYRSLPEAADFIYVDGSRAPDKVLENVCDLLNPHVAALKSSRELSREGRGSAAPN
jgi:dTMP kinase